MTQRDYCTRSRVHGGSGAPGEVAVQEVEDILDGGSVVAVEVTIVVEVTGEKIEDILYGEAVGGVPVALADGCGYLLNLDVVNTDVPEAEAVEVTGLIGGDLDIINGSKHVGVGSTWWKKRLKGYRVFAAGATPAGWKRGGVGERDGELTVFPALLGTWDGRVGCPDASIIGEVVRIAAIVQVKDERARVGVDGLVVEVVEEERADVEGDFQAAWPAIEIAGQAGRCAVRREGQTEKIAYGEFDVLAGNSLPIVDESFIAVDQPLILGFLELLK